MRETLIKRPTAITPMPVASGQLVAVRRRSSQPQHKPRSGMIERHCITTAEGCMGWIATALPGRVRVQARLVSDDGDPLRSRYEHVDYESTCIDCRKIGRSPRPQLNGVFRLGFTEDMARHW